MEKYRVALTEEERAGLEQLVSGGKSAARKLTHARILLLADEWQGQAYSDTEIVSALGVSLRTIERVRKRLVTEGFEAALEHRPQPPRPDKIKIKGNVEQKLLELACSDPPRGRCHWTLQLLVDELVVLGLVDTLSTVTVWQALKKMISNRGSSRLGVFRPQQMPSTSGAWRTCCRPISERTIHGIPLCALMKRVSNCLVRYVRRNRYAQADQPGSIMSYERKGVCHQLLMCEPLRGWRHVKVTARRTRRDYAECVRDLVERYYPQAKQIRLVQDNLNTHDGASLYEAFSPAEARRILDKIEFHYTPKHGSWLNMAETEINIMNSQCLNRWLDNQSLIATEVAAWEKKRNLAKARIHWTFTLAAARRKLRKLYPSIEV